jgi:phosphoribosylanthranilate isomerase
VAPQQPATFVKICGITRLKDARAAMRAGANAVGFIFAGSPRRISPSKARKIAAHIHPAVRRFGVFVDAPMEKILALVDEVELDGVQLQGAEPPETLEALRRARPELFLAKVVRPLGKDWPKLASRFSADAIFVDSRNVLNPRASSRPIPLSWLAGAGISHLVVGGGLTPENVSGVVSEIRPWGVDVSGGVEESPGRKDVGKVAAFVRAVREAENSRPGT